MVVRCLEPTGQEGYKNNVHGVGGFGGFEGWFGALLMVLSTSCRAYCAFGYLYFASWGQDGNSIHVV